MILQSCNYHTSCYYLQGVLSGLGIEDQLPTIAIVAHYDSYGIAPVSVGICGGSPRLSYILPLKNIEFEVSLRSSSQQRPGIYCMSNAIGSTRESNL